MTEEIIVNGFDVSECYADNKMMKDGLYCFWEGGNCEDNEYCYYKECKRLEQENKELKAYKDVNEDFKKAWDELNKKYIEVLKLAKLNADSNEYCLKKLEKENKNLKKQIESQKGLITVGGKQQYEMTMAYDKCKTALEEIRDYLYTLTTVDSDFINTETYLRINDKIEEVLNS